MTAAGLDMNKRIRACFNRIVAHAQHMIGLQAAVAFWRNAMMWAAIRTLAHHSAEQKRTLRLLRGALSHHASVLLQAIVKEWYITIRHEVISRTAYRRASLIIATKRWADAARDGRKLTAIAYGFMSGSETAIMLYACMQQPTSAARQQKVIDAAYSGAINSVV